MARRMIPIELDELESMKESGELIGKYVREPNSYRRKILGRVIAVHSIIKERDTNYIDFSSTHSRHLIVEGFSGEDRFGRYIGNIWGSRIHLDKEWRKSCRTCAYPCKRHKRCGFHSDDSVVIKR